MKSTFFEGLRWGLAQPRTALTFLPEHGDPVVLDGRELERKAMALAAVLRERFEPGARLLLLCEPGVDYVVAFLGCVYGGLVAVPAFPPDPTDLLRTLPRLQALATDAGAGGVLTTSMVDSMGEMLQQLVPGIAALPRIAVDTVDVGAADGWRAPTVRPDDVAFLQYTSGSTGNPRGVRVTQRNLAANNEHIANVRSRRDHDGVGVSWLPPYHDMGLIGAILHPLHDGGPAVLLSPVTFLRNPRRWLQAITDYRGTCSPIPNFALDLCSRRVRDDQLDGLDLSSLRCLIVGAEPVRTASLDRFAERFGPVGFRREAVFPAFGLAEATLLVSGVRHGGVPTRHDGRVGCGLPATPLRIVSPETGAVLADGLEGEIQVSGDHIADGYHGKPEESAATFLVDDGVRWLRTGDLGYLHEGELYVSGRIKDLIVHRGRNVHPTDVETSAEKVHPAIRPGGIAAFSVDDGETERVVVALEVDARKVAGELDGAAIAAAVRAAVATDHGVPPHRVVGVGARALPKTSSGKIQRRETKRALLAGELTLLFDDVGGAVDGDQRPETGDLYPELDAVAAALDDRSDKYQFDLDADVPWDRMDEAGEFLPPGLASFAWSEALPLQDDPAAWELFQWSTTLALCDVIIRLEEGLIDFVRNQGPILHRGRRSLTLLEDEERKHIALFRRFGDRLRARHPELLDVYDAAIAEHWSTLPTDGLRPGEALGDYHYRGWLQILFFEEWTLWFFQRLQAERERVHPVWLQAHKVHSQEEAQHVRTDAAWLDALAVDAGRRRAISRAQIAEIMRPMQVSNHVMHSVVGARYPDRMRVLSRPDPSAPLLALLRDRAMRRTRERAPFFEELATRSLPAEGRRVAVRRPPTEAAALAWLKEWIEEAEPGSFQPDETFAAQGLDSADALSLAGELEDWVGGRLHPTLPYEMPTPRLLAGYLAALPKVGKAAVIPRAGRPVSRRQARWLDIAGDDGLAHTVTEIYWAEGPLDDARLDMALRRVVAGHPALRARFVRGASGWNEVLDDEAGAAVRWRRVEADSLPEALRAEAEAVYHRAWVPTDPVRLRATLVRARDGNGVVLSAPHVVADAAAMHVVASQLVEGLAGAGGPLPVRDPVKVATGEGPASVANATWWRERLADLPTWTPRRRFAGRRIERMVSEEVAQRWAARAEALGVTPFVLMLSAMHLAWRELRGTDAPIGTQLASRTTPERRGMFGYLVDVALVRPDLGGVETVDEAAPRVERAWLEAVQHGGSIAGLVEALFPERLGERWLPAPVSFNLVPPADPIVRGAVRWTRMPQLLPERRSFLFYEEMVLAQTLPTGGMVLVSWFDEGAVGEAKARALLDGMVARLG